MPYKNREHGNLLERQQYGAKLALLIDRAGGACWDCGNTEKLQFHHREPTEKSFTITDRWRWVLEKLQPELDKCDLLCYGCHKERHHPTPDHGTTAMYKRGCGCAECSDANNEYHRRYMKRMRSKT